MKTSTMKSSTQHRFFTRLLLTICLMVTATAGAAPKDNKATYQIKVAAVSILGNHHTLWLRTSAGKEPVKLQLNIRVFSPPVKYKGSVMARFYGSKADAMADEPPKPIAQVKLTGRKVLVLFQPKKDATGYMAFPVEETQFPFGSFRFVNISKDKVRVDIGAKKMIILPGKSATYSMPKGEKHVLVNVIARSTITEEVRFVRRSRWTISRDQRELVLFYPNHMNGMIRSRHFVDSKVEKKEGE